MEICYVIALAKLYAFFINRENFYIQIDSFDELDRYISDHRVPAKDASERHRWAGSLDFQSAARLYNIIILICQPAAMVIKSQVPYEWRMYTPTMMDIVSSGFFQSTFSFFILQLIQVAEQNEELFTIVILYKESGSAKIGHFELVNDIGF